MALALSDTPRSSTRAEWAAAIALLTALVAFVYAEALGFDFVRFDDGDYVTANEMVKQGLSIEGFRWAWTADHSSNWHPLTWLSHMLDVELYGLDPAGHHATNVLLHLLNTWLVFALFATATGRVAPALGVAALFAGHPLHVEAVSWVSERKELLAALFGLSALLAYVAHARRGGLGWKAAVVGLFGASLLSKPMWVTLPFLLLLLDVWPLGRLRLDGSAPASARRLVLEKVPLLVLSGISSLVTLRVQPVKEAVVFGGDVSRAVAVSQNALVSYAHYLWKTLWPADLAVLYPHPSLPQEGGVALSAWQVAAAAAVLIAISAWALRPGAPRARAVGWLWYLGTLVPVIGFVQVGRQAMADRYTYVPLVGVFVIVAFGLADLLTRLRPRHPRLATAVAVASLVLVLAYANAARVQARVWRGSIPLFEHALRVTPRNPTIRYNLGNTLKSEGRIDEAIEQYRLALETKPDASEVHYNLANALRGKGLGDEAIDHYEQAVRADPGYAKAHFNLGNALRERGRMRDAVRHYRLALAAEPDLEPARRNLERALELLGRAGVADRGQTATDSTSR